MEVERYERWFMIATFGFLLAAIAALIISVVGHHASLAEPAGRIDPDEVRTTAPFDEPGLHQTGPNEYDLVMIAQAWAWTPAEVTVPVGAEVTIKATSVDVVHGLKLKDTNANVMVIPGQISEVPDLVFDEAGTHWLFCHEYCGIQHHNMAAQVHVE